MMPKLPRNIGHPMPRIDKMPPPPKQAELDKPPTEPTANTPQEVIRDYLMNRRGMVQDVDYFLADNIYTLPWRGLAWMLGGDSPGIDMVNRTVLEGYNFAVVGISGPALQEDSKKVLDLAWDGQEA